MRPPYFIGNATWLVQWVPGLENYSNKCFQFNLEF
jgi:hypothetical protein